MGGKGHSCGKLAYMVLWGAGEMVRFHTTECPWLGRLKKPRSHLSDRSRPRGPRGTAYNYTLGQGPLYGVAVVVLASTTTTTTLFLMIIDVQYVTLGTQPNL